MGLSCNSTAAAVATLALLCVAGPAVAQVNTESLRGTVPEQGLMGDLQSDVALKGGNADFLRVAGTGRLAYRAGIHTPLLFSRAEFGNAGGDDFAENAFVHGRWTAMWHPRVGSELFGQLHYDRFVRLKSRALLGAGARLVLLETTLLQLYLGSAYMLELERLDIPVTDSHPRRTRYHRSSNYLSIKLAWDERLLMTNVLYVQPRFDRPGDVRVLEQFELQSTLGAHLSLVNAVTFAFDSDPPDEVKARYDIALTAGLRLAY